MLVVLLVLAGWVSVWPGLASADPAPARPGAVPTINPPDPAAVDAAERDAVRAIDGFWRNDFPVLFHKPYTSPRVGGAYVGTGGPACGGQPSAANNAFYCPSGDFLAWDQNLMTIGYQRVGNSWIYLIIAHEWGHAIQSRLNRSLVSVAAELQADCLAGATLAGAQRQGLIALQPGDDEQLGATLTSLADNYPWTSQRDHGDARQRTASFNLGSRQGVLACLAR
ncbi:neutral zinc metallopeptidase [Pseudonocardia spinosispora]|uniref:neutral zinc metallopeptidase n=1 Tax=Pseudonocardia spinosispora TaxID=103441 RepID=UPI000567E6C2|nr:neutral zinc metallopeptidase [Pseudonocardia spinosispora]